MLRSGLNPAPERLISEVLYAIDATSKGEYFDE
jgi:hypothetical protein